MPKWVFICPKCNAQVTYSEIEEQVLELVRRDPRGKVTRPSIQPGGETQRCARCEREIKVNSCDLTYSYL